MHRLSGFLSRMLHLGISPSRFGAALLFLRMSLATLLRCVMVSSRGVGRGGVPVPPRGGVCRRSRRMALPRGFCISGRRMGVSLRRELIRMSRVALLCVFVVPSRGVGCGGVPVPPRGGVCLRSRRVAPLRGFLVSGRRMGVSLHCEVIRMSRVALFCVC